MVDQVGMILVCYENIMLMLKKGTKFIFKSFFTKLTFDFF